MRPSKVQQQIVKTHNSLRDDNLLLQYFRLLLDALGEVDQPTTEDNKRLSFEIEATIVAAEAPHSHDPKIFAPNLNTLVSNILQH